MLWKEGQNYDFFPQVNLNLGQNELVEYCQANGVVVVAYSPFGTMVPSRASPDSPEPKLNNPTMVAIAKKHGKSVTQVTLRYLVRFILDTKINTDYWSHVLDSDKSVFK